MKTLAASLCTLLLATGSAHAQWWNPMDHTPPKYWGTEFEPKVEYTRRVFEQAKMAANAFVFDDRFDKLERMYAEFEQRQLRTTDGAFMVEAVHEYFADALMAWERPMATRVMEKWEGQVPGSKLRPVIVAVMHVQQAWAARGGRAAMSTPGEAMQIFRERLAAAARALKDSEAVGQDSPIWWWTALVVAGSSGQPAASFDALFEKAVGRFPLYRSLYYTRMNYLLPQWGGSFKAVDAFVMDAVRRTQATEGRAMYAWLYLDIARKTDSFEGATAVDWTRMNEAFQDLVARYPDPWNRNLYATFACRARDRATTARLLTELGDKAALGAWSEGITTEGCRRFAFTAS